jgi:Predicted ATPase (AAA+ superfamily)
MYFSDRPINSLRLLVGDGHRRAVSRIRDDIEKGVFVAVLGPRRVGKTSVVRVVLNEFNYPYIYFDLSPYMGLRSVSYQALVPSDMRFGDRRVEVDLELNLSILKLGLKNVRVTASVFQSNLLTLMRELSRRHDRFVVVFDEAQVLPFIRGFNYRGFLQFIHDNYPNIIVILTGSMPGLLERVIAPSASEAGFARFVDEVVIDRWGLDDTVEYLSRGFNEAGIHYTRDELVEAHNVLSGIPGFIVMYGIGRSVGKSHVDALERAKEYAISQWLHDLGAFVKLYNSGVYITVLKLLANFPIGLSWSEIMSEVGRALGKPLSKSVMHRVITNLIKGGFIAKVNSNYRVEYPTLREAVIRARMPNAYY